MIVASLVSWQLESTVVLGSTLDIELVVVDAVAQVVGVGDGVFAHCDATTSGSPEYSQVDEGQQGHGDDIAQTHVER